MPWMPVASWRRELPMPSWISSLLEQLQRHERLVMVTVAAVRGSTPREPGARMLVTTDQVFNTIGGGHLEWKAITIARNMLASQGVNRLQRFSLGASLGQCCGGVVEVFFELICDEAKQQAAWQQTIQRGEDFVQVVGLDDPGQRLWIWPDQVIAIPADRPIHALQQMARQMLENNASTCIVSHIDTHRTTRRFLMDPVRYSDFQLYLFGAGHVGQALVRLLAEQPCQITWVDTRDDVFVQASPANVNTVCTDVPAAVIAEAPAGSYFLVMTHDHGLDEQLCEHILKREDSAYFGLIGSATKRKRFEHRLQQRGISEQQLTRMICPIGIDGIRSKRPAAIALAVAAELLQHHERQQATVLMDTGHPEYVMSTAS